MKEEEVDARFLTFEEADRLIDAAKTIDPQTYTMVLVALKTGLRRGELLGLQWGDIDLAAGTIRVARNIVNGIEGSPKSGKARTAHLTDDTVEALRQLPRHIKSEVVFHDERGEPLRDHGMGRALERARKAGGFGQFGWHVCRHTFASHLAMLGTPLIMIRDLMGHANIEETMRYSHLIPEVTHDAVQVLNRRPSVTDGVTREAAE